MGVSLPLFGVVFAAVAAVLVQVHPLLHERLHVLVLGHRPPVFLLNFKVRLCGWWLRARAAVSNVSGAAAAALTRAPFDVPCAASSPYAHPFHLAVFHQAMSRRTTAMQYLLCFPSQSDIFMTRKHGRRVLKAPKEKWSGH